MFFSKNFFNLVEIVPSSSFLSLCIVISTFGTISIQICFFEQGSNGPDLLWIMLPILLELQLASKEIYTWTPPQKMFFSKRMVLVNNEFLYTGEFSRFLPKKSSGQKVIKFLIKKNLVSGKTNFFRFFFSGGWGSRQAAPAAKNAF